LSSFRLSLTSRADSHSSSSAQFISINCPSLSVVDGIDRGDKASPNQLLDAPSRMALCLPSQAFSSYFRRCGQRPLHFASSILPSSLKASLISRVLPHFTHST